MCRLLRAATEACPRATVLSVDAVGAFDHVSRAAMLGALHARPQLQPLRPFARQFYAAPSAFTWYDDCHHALAQHALRRSCVLHHGKTRIWNAAGEEPNISDLGDGEESVWVGDWTILGSPLGHDAFVARHLRRKRDDQDRLLERIPGVDDLQTGSNRVAPAAFLCRHAR